MLGYENVDNQPKWKLKCKWEGEINIKTMEWWKLTDPCQEALPDRAEGEWWSAADEVFHVD